MGKYGWTNNNLVSNIVNLNKLLINASILTHSGAIKLDDFVTGFDTTGSGAAAITLKDGIEGQLMILARKTGANAAQVTPTNLEGASTRIDFASNGTFAIIYFTGGEWTYIGGTAVLA
jgi:hypothetical protein